jgi:hypothetical protein
MPTWAGTDKPVGVRELHDFFERDFDSTRNSSLAYSRSKQCENLFSWKNHRRFRRINPVFYGVPSAACFFADSHNASAGPVEFADF